MSAPLLVLLAGPNGAGKSTFYEAGLKRLGLTFLNADVLARETGIDAYEAARTIAAIRDGCIARKENSVTETVLSDPVGEKVAILAGAAVAGFDVTSNECRQSKPRRSCDSVRKGYRKRGVGRLVIFYRTADGGTEVVRILDERMDVDRQL